MEKEKTTWEKVDVTLERLKVPGGWLIENNLGGVTFVPDKEHIWDLNNYDFQ